MKRGTRVLLVEDDRSIARLLQLELEHRDLIVRAVPDGAAALPTVDEFAPDIVVLDILLPGLDGESVLALLRRRGYRTPVIMLTARDRPSDKVRNLDGGADDYLTKPFEIDELVARMSAVLRRIEPEEVLRVSDLEINTITREVWRHGSQISLTAREYDLLEMLVRNARRILSRDQILDQVWRDSLDVGTNVVDVYVGYLRKKIDGLGGPRLIQTVRGVGFVVREG